MPTELRQIVLSADETMQAIQSYARMTTHFLPHGRVLGFQLEPVVPGGDVGLIISIEAVYGKTHAPLEIKADPADVAELLIRCCLENNIPIPRHSVKTAKAIDGQLALVVSYERELVYQG